MLSDGETKRQLGPTALDALGFDLVVTDGPDAGKRLHVAANSCRRLFVGSAADSDLRLTDPTVSRRHAAVESMSMRLLVTDLKSMNGSFVNDVNVGSASLLGGETIRLGTTSLRSSIQLASGTAAELETRAAFGRLVGGSKRMRLLFATAARAAASELPVLIEGEVGTGKELLAEAIHEASARASGPFVFVECASFPSREPNIDAALFGHGKGADPEVVGLVASASGGTLVLDEVGELPAAAQARLLRIADRGAGLRVVATTSQNLDRMVEDGRFREDLLYRLAGARLELPPLRRREGDVALLAAHFWQMLTGGTSVPPALLARLAEHRWPGNVRELETAVARHLALGELATEAGGRRTRLRATAGPTPNAFSSSTTFEAILDADFAFPEARQRALDLFCAAYVERALAKHGGNVLRAAAGSGIARRYFQTIRDRGRLAR